MQGWLRADLGFRLILGYFGACLGVDLEFFKGWFRVYLLTVGLGFLWGLFRFFGVDLGRVQGLFGVDSEFM